MKLPVVIVGAGVCGLTAALAGRDAGAKVVVLERAASPIWRYLSGNGLLNAIGLGAIPGRSAAQFALSHGNR